MYARQGIRGAIATVLVTALLAGGAILGGSAANAQELPVEPVVTAPAVAESIGEPAADPVAEAPAAPAAEAAPAAAAAEAAPAAAAVTVEPSVVAADSTGLTVETALANIPAGPGAYVAVIDEGTALELTNDNMGLALEYVRATGNATSSLQVPAAKLDRAKKYEVVAWTAHPMPSEATIFAVEPLTVSGEQWDAVFGAEVVAPTIIASVTEASEAGLKLSATIENIVLRPADQGVYVGIIEKDRVDEYRTNASAGAQQDFAYKMFIRDGAVTRTIDVPAEKLDRTRQYVAVSWLAHGFLDDERFVAQADLAVSGEQWDAVFGAVEPPAEQWSPAVQVFLEGSATPLAAGAKVYTGDVLTVKGSGFDPESHPAVGRPPVTKGDPTGNYVTFGNFAQAWQPSTGAKSSERVVADQKWAMTDATFKNLNPNYVGAVVGERVVLNTDGSFAADLEVQAIPEGKTAPADGAYGVFTYVAGGGANDAAQELGVRLDFVDAERPAPGVPSIQVFRGDSVTPLAPGAKVYTDDVLTVKGSGFDPESHPATGRPPVTKGDPTGNYVTFGNFAKAWQPSTGAKSSERVVADQKWAMTDATFKNLNPNYVDGVVGQRVVLNTDGSFVADLTVQSIPADTTAPTGGSYGVFTYVAGGGANDAAQELSLRFDFVNSERPVDPKPKPDPGPGVDPIAPTPGSKQPGALAWGISSGFASYATGSIAKGEVRTTGVGASGGAYVFPQASSSWNAESQTGSVQYSGTVTFSGHKGAMTETFSNPVITVTSASAGTISAGGYTFGLNLAAASKSVGANGEVTWRGVPVAGSISGGGSAGGGTGGGAFAVDPVSFTVGAVNGANYGSTSVESTAGKKRNPASAPPATSGITVVTDPTKIVPGGEIEFEATGFEANERDILVVLYSEPTLLDDNAGANKAGTVRWLGKLPENIEPGEHTLTLQGSTNAGIKITVLEKEAAEKAQKKARQKMVASASESNETTQAAGVLSNTGTPMWVWWAGAGFLLILAATTTGLVIAQRREK